MKNEIHTDTRSMKHAETLIEAQARNAAMKTETKCPNCRNGTMFGGFRCETCHGSGKIAATTQAAQAAGFTRHVFASSEAYDLSLMVRHDADLGDTFAAWDRDEAEYITVNGWLFNCEEAA